MPKEITLELVDAFSTNRDTLLGWTIPAKFYNEFLAALDKAALAAGGTPVQEIALDKDAAPTESELNRNLIDERENLLAEANDILGS